MAGKVIHSVIECGWRVVEICFHPIDESGKVSYIPCKPANEHNFPPKCPLSNCPKSEEDVKKCCG
jgi:hypothetical protein